jgi:hypothetical protein
MLPASKKPWDSWRSTKAVEKDVRGGVGRTTMQAWKRPGSSPAQQQFYRCGAEQRNPLYTGVTRGNRLGVLARCRALPSREVDAWQRNRNTHHAKADWQFTTAEPRVKLKSLYPQFE